VSSPAPDTVTTTSTPWRVVAIDDEPPALKAFARMLEPWKDFQLAATCSDPLVAVTLIREIDPDVVFLDVHMPGLSGFDILKSLGADAPPVVFITAYDQFAVRAFEAEAVDYLLKPIDRERFALTLDRLRRSIGVRQRVNIVPQLESLLRHFSTRSAPTAPVTPGVQAWPRIGVRQGGKTTMLDSRLIDRIDSADNDIVISTGSQKLRVRETLTAFEARLPAGQFLRVHRSCVINAQRIVHFERWFHGDLVIHLTNGTTVTSGRTYRAAVRAALGLRADDAESS
jgi:two-component system, LytTR family, response regulator